MTAENDQGADRSSVSTLTELLPVIVFLFLSAMLCLSGKIVATPGWFLDAVSHAETVNSKGVGWFASLPALCDPRLFFSSLFLVTGLSDLAALSIIRLWAILCGASAVYLLSRQYAGRIGFDRFAAWFLAVAPIWVSGAARGDAYVVLGFLFLALTRLSLPFWLRLLAISWSLSWSNWAWVSLLPLLLDKSSARPGQKWIAIGSIFLAIILMWVISPTALTHPGDWFSEIVHQITSDGFWSGGAHVGTSSGLWPITGTVHFAGMILILIAVYHWTTRVRNGSITPVIFCLVLALGSRSSYAADSVLLLMLPFAASELGLGWGRCREFVLRKIGRPGLAILLVLLLIPQIMSCYRITPPPVQEEAHQLDAAAWLEQQLPAGSLVAHDMGFTPPAESDLVWFSLPFNALEPQMHSAAHWPGWFQSVAAFVISERLVIRFLKDSYNCRLLLDFYKQITSLASSDTPFGVSVEKRSRVLLMTPDQDNPLRHGWRQHIALGPDTGLTGDFVANLGSALSASGNTEIAITFLEEAISAGYQNIGIHITLAAAFREIGRLNEAGRILDDGYRKFSDSPELMFDLALVLVEGERWKRAAAILARLHLIWPKSVKVSLLLGFAMLNDNHPLAAQKQLEKTLTLEPTAEQRSEINRLLDGMAGDQ